MQKDICSVTRTFGSARNGESGNRVATGCINRCRSEGGDTDSQRGKGWCCCQGDGSLATQNGPRVDTALSWFAASQCRQRLGGGARQAFTISHIILQENCRLNRQKGVSGDRTGSVAGNSEAARGSKHSLRSQSWNGTRGGL